MMRLCISVFLSLLVSTCSLHAQSEFPEYHPSSELLFTSPGSMGTGLYGYFNPAVLTYQHQPDLLFSISDPEDNLKQYKQLGFFAAFPRFSFGVINERLPVIGGRTPRVTNYNLAFSYGDRRWSGGLAYHWSTDNMAGFERKSRVALGSLLRPSSFISLGLTSALATSGGRWEEAADLAFRPFNDEHLTLFGDFALQKGQDLDEGGWSAGAVVEALPGFRVTGRYFDNETFTIGVNLSLGHAGISTQSHFNSDRDYGYNTWTIRLGAMDRSFIHNAVTKGSRYMKVDLNGPMRYQRFRLFDSSNTLLEMIENIESARRNDSVSGIAINMSGMRINREMLWEIREKLKDFRSSGKKVIVYLDNVDIDRYHLASVADEVVMDPEGVFMIPGHLMGLTFLKGTLEKIGIGFEEWRYFKYKSAAEALSRDSMSEADREQRQELVDDRYQLARSDICDGRGFSYEQFDRLVDDGLLFTPSEALELGLVDRIGRWGEDIHRLIEDLEGEEKTLVSPARLKLDDLPPDARWGVKPRIAVIYAIGVCAMDRGITARRLVKDVEAVTKDDGIKAVVFRVDSPGGDALASSIVADALKKCSEKKPVIVSQGYVAASGGYWLSMYGDQIVAAPNTITGSIGVIGGWIYNKGLKERLGMSTDYVKAGDHADAGFGMTIPFLGLTLPDRKLNAEEKEKVEHLIKTSYASFVDKVASGRGRSTDEIEEIAQGRVWSGSDAVDNGLVDTTGGLETAVTMAKERAGISRDADVTIAEYPEKGLMRFDNLVSRISGVKVESEGNGLIDQLTFRLDHNGRPMPILPLEEIESEGMLSILDEMK